MICYEIPDYFENDINEAKCDLKGFDRVSGTEVDYWFMVHRFNKQKYLQHIESDKNKLSLSNENDEYQYLRCLYKTLNAESRYTRNATTFSYFGDQIRFDVRENFPLLTTKKMAVKSIFEELKFFLLGQTDDVELESSIILNDVVEC